MLKKKNTNNKRKKLQCADWGETDKFKGMGRSESTGARRRDANATLFLSSHPTPLCSIRYYLVDTCAMDGAVSTAPLYENRENGRMHRIAYKTHSH